jgi:hypothetical protein
MAYVVLPNVAKARNNVLLLLALSPTNVANVNKFKKKLCHLSLRKRQSKPLQCLLSKRFVIQLCLQFWSGGKPVLLASPQVMSFWPT